MNFLKPISISLSPNTEKDDIWLALKMIWRIILRGTKPSKTQNCTKKLEHKFRNYLNIKQAISFNSGRSAFFAILNSLELNPNDKVLVQAFTCNAAINPIIWAGLKPVYVDCDEKTFNIDIEDLERKIIHSTNSSQAPKVLMVQHTFGLPADMDKILKICEQNNLILIEDCAHSLGATYREKKVGTFGRAAFFSFSRDKIISSVYGGIAITNDIHLAGKIRAFQQKIGYPSCVWIIQQLLHPILMNWLILPIYGFSCPASRALNALKARHFGIGKYLLILFQWLHILSKAVHWKEKRGRKPSYFPKQMPTALACLALNQFKKLDKFNQHRKKITNFYFEKLKRTCFKLPEIPKNCAPVFLRFTIKHPKAHQIIKKAWQENILIGDWYTSPIAPYDTKLDKLQYKLGLCPTATKLAQETLNLPTHINISKKQAQKIIDFLLSNPWNANIKG